MIPRGAVPALASLTPLPPLPPLPSPKPTRAAAETYGIFLIFGLKEVVRQILHGSLNEVEDLPERQKP